MHDMKAAFHQHVAALVALDRDCFTSKIWGADGFLRDVTGKWELSHLAFRNGALAGFIVASNATPGIAHINRLAVSPAVQRSGVGKDLVARMEQSARGLGLDMATLETDAHEHDVTAVYAKLGYTVASPAERIAYAARKNKTLPDGQGVMLKSLTLEAHRLRA